MGLHFYDQEGVRWVQCASLTSIHLMTEADATPILQQLASLKIIMGYHHPSSWLPNSVELSTLIQLNGLGDESVGELCDRFGLDPNNVPAARLGLQLYHCLQLPLRWTEWINVRNWLCDYTSSGPIAHESVVTHLLSSCSYLKNSAHLRKLAEQIISRAISEGHLTSHTNGQSTVIIRNLSWQASVEGHGASEQDMAQSVVAFFSTELNGLRPDRAANKIANSYSQAPRVNRMTWANDVMRQAEKMGLIYSRAGKVYVTGHPEGAPHP